MTENGSDPGVVPTAGHRTEVGPDGGTVDGVVEPTRRNRWNVVLAVAVAGLLVAAGFVASRARADQQAASHLHRSTSDLDQQHDQLVNEADGATAERLALASAASAAGVALDDLGPALDDLDTAQNQLADDLNDAARLHNSGNEGAARAELQGAAAAALSDFQQKVAALGQAITDAQTKSEHLQEVNHV